MSDELHVKIMRLFGVPGCGACSGSGYTTDFYGSPHEPPAHRCSRCDGLGVTLLDATRENWPWRDHWYGKGYMPENFPNDPAAALLLAHKTKACAVFCDGYVAVTGLAPNAGGGRVLMPVGAPRGSTLGAALIAALEETS